MPSMYSSASLVAGLVLYTAVSAAPQQAYTITNSAGEVVTLLPTTTVGLDTGLVTVPVGTPILGPSSNDEGTMIVTLPVEPTDANGSTVFPPVSIPPVSIPPVSMPTIIDPPIVSGGPTLSLSVPPVPMPTVITTGSSSSGIGGGGGGGSSSTTTRPAGSSNSASLPPPTSTVAPAAAPRATGFAGAAVGVVAAVAGVLYL